MWEYAHSAGAWFAGLSRGEANDKARELGLVIDWLYVGAPHLRAR